VKTPNVWAIADEIWERRRQLLAEHFEVDNKIFDLFPKRPHVDKSLSIQMESTPTCACADELTTTDRSDKENDEHDLANAAEGDDRSWRITKYLLDEDNPDYNERHALSQALERWTVDKVREMEQLILDVTLTRDPSRDIPAPDKQLHASIYRGSILYNSANVVVEASALQPGKIE
jgi:hypothetical protein